MVGGGGWWVWRVVGVKGGEVEKGCRWGRLGRCRRIVVRWRRVVWNKVGEMDKHHNHTTTATQPQPHNHKTTATQSHNTGLQAG